MQCSIRHYDWPVCLKILPCADDRLVLGLPVRDDDKLSVGIAM
jgi:hypothetical protein